MNTEKKYLLYFGVGVVIVCFIYFFAITFLPVKGEKYTDIILGALIGSGFTGILSLLGIVKREPGQGHK